MWLVFVVEKSDPKIEYFVELTGEETVDEVIEIFNKDFNIGVSTLCVQTGPSKTEYLHGRQQLKNLRQLTDMSRMILSFSGRRRD